ncbi:MAG: peptidase M23 [Gammaproteobacteria bacterium]|nr:MAG: peptidase M23 [Gammaproteobacteria bacterium]
MMRLLLVLLMLVLTACGGSRAIVPVGNYGFGNTSSTASKTKAQAPGLYKVKKGDTLYSISWRYGMDYKHVAKMNNIRSPYNIYIGQKLYFKNVRAKTTTTKKKVITKKTTKTVKKSLPSNQALAWRWPTKGKVISKYSQKAAGRKGIDIAGTSGQHVIAAAKGKVVYSGSGLPRYGNLLIIKHNDTYLSAYAHNKVLLVKEGQWVKAGQKVALLGQTGTQRNQLHFEIRRNGKPVDPLKFLPKSY